MTALVTPRLEVVADRDRLHAVVFCRDGDLHQLTWIELFGRSLVTEFQWHGAPLAALLQELGDGTRHVRRDVAAQTGDLPDEG